MVIALVVILVGVFLPIVYPLIRRRAGNGPGQDESQRKMAAMIGQKESSYAAINELEMDYRTGKVSDSDYSSLFERYKSEALQAIHALKEGQSEETEFWDTAIEQEIEERRRNLERQIEEVDGDLQIPCPTCGTENGPTRIICSHCGADMRRICRQCNTVNSLFSSFCRDCGESLQTDCPHCGSSCDPWSRFCPQCGAETTFTKERE